MFKNKFRLKEIHFTAVVITCSSISDAHAVQKGKIEKKENFLNVNNVVHDYKMAI